MSAGDGMDDDGGTPQWSPVEILRGDSGPTLEADVYSLGVVIWEIVCRQPPFLDVHSFDVKVCACMWRDFVCACILWGSVRCAVKHDAVLRVHM